MSKIEFESSTDKKDGIYRITDNDKKIIKYYQVINGKNIELTLYNNSFLEKKLSNMESYTNLTFRECKDIFSGIIEKPEPIDSNSITVIKNPIEVYVDIDPTKKDSKKHRVVEFNDNRAYIKFLKKYISNNTDPKIQANAPYIKDIYKARWEK